MKRERSRRRVGGGHGDGDGDNGNDYNGETAQGDDPLVSLSPPPPQAKESKNRNSFTPPPPPLSSVKSNRRLVGRRAGASAVLSRQMQTMQVRQLSGAMMTKSNSVRSLTGELLDIALGSKSQEYSNDDDDEEEEDADDDGDSDEEFATEEGNPQFAPTITITEESSSAGGDYYTRHVLPKLQQQQQQREHQRERRARDNRLPDRKEKPQRIDLDDDLKQEDTKESEVLLAPSVQERTPPRAVPTPARARATRKLPTRQRSRSLTGTRDSTTKHDDEKPMLYSDRVAQFKVDAKAELQALKAAKLAKKASKQRRRASIATAGAETETISKRSPVSVSMNSNHSTKSPGEKKRSPRNKSSAKEKKTNLSPVSITEDVSDSSYSEEKSDQTEKSQEAIITRKNNNRVPNSPIITGSPDYRRHMDNLSERCRRNISASPRISSPYHHQCRRKVSIGNSHNFSDLPITSPKDYTRKLAERSKLSSLALHEPSTQSAFLVPPLLTSTSMRGERTIPAELSTREERARGRSGNDLLTQQKQKQHIIDDSEPDLPDRRKSKSKQTDKLQRSEHKSKSKKEKEPGETLNRSSKVRKQGIDSNMNDGENGDDKEKASKKKSTKNKTLSMDMGSVQEGSHPDFNWEKKNGKEMNHATKQLSPTSSGKKKKDKAERRKSMPASTKIQEACENRHTSALVEDTTTEDNPAVKSTIKKLSQRASTGDIASLSKDKAGDDCNWEKQTYSWEKPDWTTKTLKTTGRGDVIKTGSSLAAPVTHINKNKDESRDTWTTKPSLKKSTRGDAIKHGSNLAAPVTHVNRNKAGSRDTLAVKPSLKKSERGEVVGKGSSLAAPVTHINKVKDETRDLNLAVDKSKLRKSKTTHAGNIGWETPEWAKTSRLKSTDVGKTAREGKNLSLPVTNIAEAVSQKESLAWKKPEWADSGTKLKPSKRK